MKKNDFGGSTGMKRFDFEGLFCSKPMSRSWL